MDDYSGSSMARNRHLVAEPYQQTPSQFMNRPDVAVHARIFPKGEAQLPTHVTNLMTEGLHAGTEKAAFERVNNMQPEADYQPAGHKHQGFETAAHYGTVERDHMENTPHDLAEDEGVFSAEGMSHGMYYKNDAEDVGSTSVMIPGGNRPVPGPNRPSTDTPGFKTWRRHVGEALADPSKAHTVPHHVRAIYEASGGAEGSHAVYPEGLKPMKDDGKPFSFVEQPALAPFATPQGGVHQQWSSPHDPFNPDVKGSRARQGEAHPQFVEMRARNTALEMQAKGQRVPNAIKRAAGYREDSKKVY